MSDENWRLSKRSTGISGIDELTYGGLPRGQATLILGEMGTGKTILSLQILAHAIQQSECCVFVTFEETPSQVRRNADSFSWGHVLTESDDWSIIDARSSTTAEVAGGFDIGGLLAAIGSRVAKGSDPWIVIDGIDQLLQHQADERIATGLIRELNEHCEKHGWTLLLSGKHGGSGLSTQHLEGVEYMLPTLLVLTATVTDHCLNRFIRVAKYRGSAHVSDEIPLVINSHGMQLPYVLTPSERQPPAYYERISTGVEPLDQILGGGIYKGSSLLISGRPGTAKSTLAASLAKAAAERGERTLLVSFDEVESHYVRNLVSVDIKLQSYLDAGLILFRGKSATGSLISEHLLKLQLDIESFKPHCLIIDPVSAFLKAPGKEGPRPTIECLLDTARSEGITTVMTSLTNGDDPQGESTLGYASTIADSWIVLDYNVRAGERNRSLSIVKSRGTAHSNQQRELILSDSGIDLAPVFEYGTEVLMGTARLQKQNEEHVLSQRKDIERARRRNDLERRIEQAKSEIARVQAEMDLEGREYEEESKLGHSHSEEIVRNRQLLPNQSTDK